MKTKISAVVEIAIVLCSVFLVAPAIATAITFSFPIERFIYTWA